MIPSDSVVRRLAALMSADVKGYARLMGEDELATVRTLTLYRQVMTELIHRFRGRVVDSPGDNLLAEFGSVVDAVQCAVEIQRDLRLRNAELPAPRRMEFRVGINLGDVIVEGERLYGDEVNVASRLEGLAEPGGICLSGTAYDHVVNKLPFEYEPLGEHTLKNISWPVPVYRVRLEERAQDPSSPGPSVPRPAPPSGRGGRLEARPLAPAPSSPPSVIHRSSIAVLPFSEHGVPQNQNYFGDGIIEEMVGALASLPDLFVISRGSTFPFRGGQTDVRSVGRKLGVRYVVSGSVRRIQSTIRIAAELADAETRAVLWTDRVDGQADDIFALQDRLCQRIVTTIAPHVRQAELRRAQRQRPDSLDAYDCVLRGLDLLYRLRRGEFDRAREMFQRASELDPGYATPYALSAVWHSVRIGQGWSTDTRRDYETVERLSRAALERDPFDARALALCGHVRALLSHDYDGAFALFERAIAASPNSAEAWVRSSPAHSYVGDGAEAKRRAALGLRLSPFDPHLFFTHTALGLACYTSGEHDEAAAWCRKAMSQNPNYTANLRFLAASLAAAGLTEEAQVVGRALLVHEPAFRVEAFCSTYAYKESSRREGLAQHLRSAGLPG